MTVTAEAPLIDLKNSAGGNIAPRQWRSFRRWSQLDGAGAACAGQPTQAAHRYRRANPVAGSQQQRGARVPAQRRRPRFGRHRNGCQASRADSIAELVHLEPVRRDDGPATVVQGTQSRSPAATSCRLFPRQLPRQQFNAKSFWARRAVENQQFSTRLVADHQDSSTTSATMITSASEDQHLNSPYPVFNVSLTGRNPE